MDAEEGGSMEWSQSQCAPKKAFGEASGASASASAVLGWFDSAGGRLALDARYDRQERLKKLGRELTLESKRLIFHLHRLPALHLVPTFSVYLPTPPSPAHPSLTPVPRFACTFTGHYATNNASRVSSM